MGIDADLPANADVDRRPLVPGREESIAAVSRTHDRGAVRVREDGVVEPHSTIIDPRSASPFSSH
jgi:hypothetical protein